MVANKNCMDQPYSEISDPCLQWSSAPVVAVSAVLDIASDEEIA